jgi:hypothetical protein
MTLGFTGSNTSGVNQLRRAPVTWLAKYVRLSPPSVDQKQLPYW